MHERGYTMRRMLRVTVIFMLLALMTIAVHGESDTSAKAGGFSGDLVITEPDTTIKARLYFQGYNVHRLEMSEEAGGMIFIRPPEARGKIWKLDPTKKQYTMLLPGFPAREDPLEAWTDIQMDMRGAPGGEDVVDGHPCRVYHFKYADEDPVAVKVWYADDVKHEIRIEADAKLAIGVKDSSLSYRTMKGTFEIRNIKIEDIDDALFEIPQDYVDVGKASPKKVSPKEKAVPKGIADMLVGKWEIAPNGRSVSGSIVFSAAGTYEMEEKHTDGTGVGVKGEYKLDTSVSPARIDLCLDKCGQPGSEWTTRFGIIRVLAGGKMEIHTSPDGNYPSVFSDEPADEYTMILTKVK